DRYSPQAWLSGGFPYFLVNASMNFCADGVLTWWLQTSGQMPIRLVFPAPHATAVSKAKPATGYGSPYSTYCFMKFVICAPARFDTTTSGLALRILRRYAEKSAASVGTRSSPTNSAPLASMKRLAALRRS